MPPLLSLSSRSGSPIVERNTVERTKSRADGSSKWSTRWARTCVHQARRLLLFRLHHHPAPLLLLPPPLHSTRKYSHRTTAATTAILTTTTIILIILIISTARSRRVSRVRWQRRPLLAARAVTQHFSQVSSNCFFFLVRPEGNKIATFFSLSTSLPSVLASTRGYDGLSPFSTPYNRSCPTYSTGMQANLSPGKRIRLIASRDETKTIHLSLD